MVAPGSVAYERKDECFPTEEEYVYAIAETLRVDELRELLVDAWRMCVPRKVAAAYKG